MSKMFFCASASFQCILLRCFALREILKKLVFSWRSRQQKTLATLRHALTPTQRDGEQNDCENEKRSGHLPSSQQIIQPSTSHAQRCGCVRDFPP